MLQKYHLTINFDETYISKSVNIYFLNQPSTLQIEKNN